MRVRPAKGSGQVRLDNRLPGDDPRRLTLDAALRSAFEGFSGCWEVFMDAVGESGLRVVVIAPDGARWALNCLSPEAQRPDRVAGAVRAACDHRRSLNPPGPRKGRKRAEEPTESRRGGKPKSEAAPEAKPLAPRRQRSQGSRA